MVANRISYFLKINGVSPNIDTACSSALCAFVEAYESLRRGDCDYAIVTSCNLCFDPMVTLQFARYIILHIETFIPLHHFL